MKKMILVLGLAGLFAGCASRNDNNMGGSEDTSGSSSSGSSSSGSSNTNNIQGGPDSVPNDSTTRPGGGM